MFILLKLYRAVFRKKIGIFLLKVLRLRNYKIYNSSIIPLFQNTISSIYEGIFHQNFNFYEHFFTNIQIFTNFQFLGWHFLYKFLYNKMRLARIFLTKKILQKSKFQEN